METGTADCFYEAELFTRLFPGLGLEIALEYRYNADEIDLFTAISHASPFNQSKRPNVCLSK